MRRGALVLMLAGTCSVAWCADGSDPLAQGLIFLQGFDADGTAWLRGGLGEPFAVAPGDLTSGRFGQGCQFEAPYANLLPPGIAEPAKNAAEFTAGTGVVLRTASGGMQATRLLAAEARSAGLLWRSQPVEVTDLPNPHRPVKAFLASVYLRAARPGVRVRLLIQDDIETTAWRDVLLEESARERKKEPKREIKPPLETLCRTQEVTLATDWQRVTADIRVDTRRPVQRLRLSLELLDPGARVVEASALQVEHYLRYPDQKAYAGPWIPGGTRRESNALRMPLHRTGFEARSGTMACWLRIPPVEGGGSRSGAACVHAGGGWWSSVWRIGAGSCHAGDSGKGNYTAGSSLIRPSGLQVNDGAWHHLALTWAADGCVLYADGREVGRATYQMRAPAPAASLIIGATALDGSHCDAVLDEVALWDRALSVAEIGTLHTRADSLAEALPPWVVAHPDRLVFHRGETEVPLSLGLLPLRSSAYPKTVQVNVPALGVRQTLSPSPRRPAMLRLDPWKAVPGEHPFTITAGGGEVAVSNVITIVGALPSRDFVMLAWDSGADLPAYGFTAELTGVAGLETVLRRGMLASLRLDTRAWHPLDPARLPESLATAQGAARSAAVYPHVYASMINTEVGITKPPAADWFNRWLRGETGLDQPPPEIRYGPLRVVQTNAQPALVAEDDPLLRYLRWIMRDGKGWPVLNAQLAATMRRTGLDDVMFYTDQPGVGADARGLDAVDYWDYPHVSSGLIVEFNRVCNIARLAGTRVSLMPGTIFWDPWPFHVEKQIVCLTPDLMRQYLWIAVASPLDHLGIYGMGELRKGYVPAGTDETLRRTLREVYPVGLLTGGLPPGPRRVAYLRTDSLFWHGAGDNTWIDTWYTRATTRALAEARLRFDMINDEHVAAGWLKHYDAVLLTGVERLPAATHKRLLAFLEDGGQVVVDRRCRAELPGATVLDFAGRNRSEEAVQALQTWARAHRSGHPEPLRLREADEAWLLDKTDDEARFIFVVNDRMVPGELGGKREMKANLGASTGPLRDQGTAQRVVLTCPADAGNALYDVRAHAALETVDGSVELDLPPGDAALLALLPRPIHNVEAAGPEALRAGEAGVLRITVRDSDGRRIGHRDLVEVQLNGPDGIPLEVPRYHRVDRGTVEIPIRLPLSAPPGTATLAVTEWIAGKRATCEVRLLPP